MNAPSIRKPLDGLAYAMMFSLCLCWGFQQTAVKATAPAMSPILQIGLRSLLAALLVCVLMLCKRHDFSFRDGTLGPGIVTGVLFGAEFLAVSTGLLYTTASHIAVFLYTAPVFTALGLHWLVKEERLNRLQWIGVAISFSGILLAFSGGFIANSAVKDHMLLGDALGVAAGALWAATTLVIRRSTLAEAEPTKMLLYQLVGAAVLLLPVALAAHQTQSVTFTPLLEWSLLFQTVVVGFASFLAWCWMLRKYLASRLSVFSFLTPLFGVTFGVLLLHEPLDPRFVLGAFLVLVGIVVVNRRT